MTRLWSSVAAMVGAVALALAGVCHVDSASPVLMLLSVAAPVWAFLALCAFLTFAFVIADWRKRGPALVAACAALFLLAGDLREAPVEISPVAHRGGALRIVEFNLSSRNSTPAKAAAWIVAQRPDVAILLEATGQASTIAAAVQRDLPYRTGCRGERPCSTVILSRLPPAEQRGLSHGDADNRRVLSAALIRFGAPRPPVTIVAVHLSRPLPLGRQAREIDQLVASLAGRDDRHLIVTGDFNAPGWSIAMRRVARGLKAQPMPAPPSWPATGPLPPLLTIDHSLLRGEWALAELHRGPSLGSDHRPFLLVVKAADHAVAG